MNEKQINEKMLNAFPELKEEFDKYVSWQDGMATGAFLTNALTTNSGFWT